jgi:hypothetical protein
MNERNDLLKIFSYILGRLIIQGNNHVVCDGFLRVAQIGLVVDCEYGFYFQVVKFFYVLCAKQIPKV